MESWSERRSHRRYPIRLYLEYTLLDRNRVARTGRGQTVNISTDGFWFESDADLPAGMWIEFSIGWPVLLNNKVRMTLRAEGRIVRAQGNRTAVKMRYHAFWTKASPKVP